jgi:hypothetical protein
LTLEDGTEQSQRRHPPSDVCIRLHQALDLVFFLYRLSEISVRTNKSVRSATFAEGDAVLAVLAFVTAVLAFATGFITSG